MTARESRPDWRQVVAEWVACGAAAEAAARARDFTAYWRGAKHGRTLFRALQRCLAAVLPPAEAQALRQALRTGADAWQRVPPIVTAWQAEVRTQLEQRSHARRIGRRYTGATGPVGTTVRVVSDAPAPGNAGWPNVNRAYEQDRRRRRST